MVVVCTHVVSKLMSQDKRSTAKLNPGAGFSRWAILQGASLATSRSINNEQDHKIRCLSEALFCPLVDHKVTFIFAVIAYIGI